ncbi:MAG: ABC transporter permease [Planctomycetota bacterium]
MPWTLPRRVEYARDLLAVLVLKELRVRYKRTVLGYAWSLLQPLAFAAVFYVVFKSFIRIDTGDVDYTLFLVCGLFAWQWFANGVTTAPLALVGNGPLIAKVAFPRVFAVLSGFVNDAVHYLLALPVVLGAVFAFGYPPRWGWLWGVPVLLVVQGGLVLGLALGVSALNLFLRDLERLTGIGVLMLFYLTPVVYPVSYVPAGFGWWLHANPMAGLVINWRSVLLGEAVDGSMLAASAGWAAAALAAGGLVFARLRDRFAEAL